jgi:hypothetical protein
VEGIDCLPGGRAMEITEIKRQRFNYRNLNADTISIAVCCFTLSTPYPTLSKNRITDCRNIGRPCPIKSFG